MQRSRKSLFQAGRKALALGVTIGLGAWNLPAKPSDVQSTQTMKNLNAALNGERNAHTKYLAFAQRADEEGYGAVASLFRAAATAEEIHGNNHERAIRKLGGTPDVKPETPTVQSTTENLQAAISGESHERKTMYPEFIHQARQDRNVPAIVTFEQAMRTEEEHAKFFEEALRDLDKLKGSGPRTYYVCTVCGYTTTDLNFEKCLNCFKPKDRYKAVG
jgi:rubrerythrin